MKNDADHLPLVTAGERRWEKILHAVAFTARALLQGVPWRHSIRQALERFGTATGVSRVYIFRCHDEGRRVSQMFEWSSEGVVPQIDNPDLQNLPSAEAGMERWIEVLRGGEVLHGLVDDMPEAERALLRAQDIESVAVVPIFVEERFWGFLGFDDCAEQRRWSEAEIDGLRAAAGLLGAALFRERAQRALSDSEERFRVLVENVPGVVYLCRNDARFSMIYLSDEVVELTGEPAPRFLSDELSFVELYHPDDREMVLREVAAAVEEWRPFHLEYRLRHADGDFRWIEERGQGVFDRDGQLQYLEGTLVDISSRKSAEERLAHNAFHDPLTDLPNRNLFRDRLDVAMARARRHPEARFAVVYLDLDRFKLINDSLGHRAGDQVLLGIAERLAEAVWSSDTLARLGGDEFAVLLEELTDPSDALRRVEHLQAELARPFVVDGREVYTGATVGIALSDPRYGRPDEMLRDADLAMYRAKAAGGGQRLVFDPEMHRLAMQRLDLESALRRALAQHEFVLHYQPIVRLADGKVSGLEALVRWRHPERGLLLPADFLDVAQETGLILPLGRWVLQTACADLARLRAEAPQLTVYVNMDGREFTQIELAERIGEVLAAAGLPPDALCLELTEHVVMQDPAETRRILEQLRELGVGVVIDDFGTGYSSLSHLHRLPVDTLKVDRSFIARMDGGGTRWNDSGASLVESIASLARALDLGVVAEGVETEMQYRAVRALGYDAGQGYHFARPMELAAIEVLLAGDPPW